MWACTYCTYYIHENIVRKFLCRISTYISSGVSSECSWETGVLYTHWTKREYLNSQCLYKNTVWVLLNRLLTSQLIFVLYKIQSFNWISLIILLVLKNCRSCHLSTRLWVSSIPPGWSERERQTRHTKENRLSVPFFKSDNAPNLLLSLKNNIPLTTS